MAQVTNSILAPKCQTVLNKKVRKNRATNRMICERLLLFIILFIYSSDYRLQSTVYSFNSPKELCISIQLYHSGKEYNYRRFYRPLWR